MFVSSVIFLRSSKIFLSSFENQAPVLPHLCLVYRLYQYLYSFDLAAEMARVFLVSLGHQNPILDAETVDFYAITTLRYHSPNLVVGRYGTRP